MSPARRFQGAMLASVLLLAACTSGAEPSGGIGPIPHAPGVDLDEAPAPTPESGVADAPTPESEVADAEVADSGDQDTPDSSTDPDEDFDTSAAPEVEVDVSVVPDVVTPAYVEAVYVELERLFFEALLILRTEGELTIDVTDRLGSALTERHYQLRLREFLGFVEDGFPGLHDPDDLRPRVRRVVALLDVAPDCLYAETTTDYSGFSVDPPHGEISFVVLRSSDGSRHVDLNASPWVYSQIAVGDPEVLRAERPC